MIRALPKTIAWSLVCVSLLLHGCTGDEFAGSSNRVQSTAKAGAPSETDAASGGAVEPPLDESGATTGELPLADNGSLAGANSSGPGSVAGVGAGAAASAGAAATSGPRAGSAGFSIAGSKSTAGANSYVSGAASAGARALAGSGAITTSGLAGAAGLQTLRDVAAATHVWIGAALAAYRLSDAKYSSVAASEFNYLTPENEMKWSATEVTPNVFTFSSADQLVTFAQLHQMRVKGHTLVWHSQLPVWVQNLTTPDAVRQAMTNHIQTVAGHFKGKLAAWDVVNEAIDDAAGNPLRNSVFRVQLGDTYIDEAFILARKADPNALLFYNDYGIDGLSNKANAAYALLERLLAAGVPIDGVGLQMHIRGTGSPTVADIIANMKRIAQLGLLVNISELDVSLCAVTGDQSAKFAVQQQRYREVVAACAAEPKCHAVTFWGFTDKYSWLNASAPCTGTGQTGSPWPLPFDDTYNRKPAYTGIMNALLGR